MVEKEPENRTFHDHISGIELARVYDPETLEGWDYAAQLGEPGMPPLPAATTQRAIGAGFGPCGSTPDMRRRRNRTAATATCSSRDKAASR